LREEFEDALQIQLGELTVVAPLQGRAVELISGELRLGWWSTFERGASVEHGGIW
jgi:hypothetical protein